LATGDVFKLNDHQSKIEVASLLLSRRVITLLILSAGDVTQVLEKEV